MPVSENKVIAGMDHNRWSTLLSAAANKSPDVRMIVNMSK
jgi:hypothetical protein